MPAASVGGAELRQAGTGRSRRRSSSRDAIDGVSRRDLLADDRSPPVTDRLRLAWPDPTPFVDRGGRPIRILAVSDEPDPSLDSPGNREQLATVDLIIGAGDLEPEYLSFVADAFDAPLRYVRGNHDVGAAWAHTGRALLPEPMRDGRVVDEAGLRLMGFSGSPTYNAQHAGLEVVTACGPR